MKRNSGEMADWCWEASDSTRGPGLLAKMQVSSATGHWYSNQRMGQTQPMRYPALAARSEDTHGPSWESATSSPKTVGMVAGPALGAAAVEVGTRKCPGHVLTEPWEKCLVAAKPDRSAVWRKFAWTVGGRVRRVCALIEL